MERGGRPCCAVLLCGVAFGLAGCLGRTHAATVMVDATKRYQTILGWGKNTPHLDVPELLRDQIVEQMVNDLGLTRLRLEPPAGNRRLVTPWEWRNDNGDPYDIDWSKLNVAALDARAVEWLVPIKWRVEANGDPFNLYVSPSFFDGGSSGSVPVWLLNNPEEYAEWATAILIRLRDKHGIVADYYSICNEAGNNNAFSPPVVGRMIRALGPRLRELGLPTTIAFMEGVNAQTTWNYIQALQTDPDMWPFVGMISYHLYGNNDPRPQIRDFAWDRKLPTGQTEFMGLDMNHLYDDLTLGGCSYWEIYGLGGPVAENVTVFADSSSFNGGPHYWSFRQVMHYVRPGAVRIEATSDEPALRVLAFDREGQVTVVLINNTPPGTPRNVLISGLPPGTYGACQSVRDRPYEELGVLRTRDGRLTVDVPGDAVLTVYPRREGNLPPHFLEWQANPKFLLPPNSSVTLTASAVDPDLDQLEYTWKLVSQPEGASVSLASPTAQRSVATGLSVPGQYVFSITARDGASSNTRKVMLTVFKGNQPPVPVDVHNRLPVRVCLPVTATELRAGGHDPEKDPLTQEWSIVSQPAGAAAWLETPSAQRCKVSNLTVPGDYVFRFTLSDPTHTVTEDLKVTVFPDSSPPVIDIITASAVVNGKATLSARTHDPEGDVITHWWSAKRCPAGAKPRLMRAGLPVTPVTGLTVPGDYVFALTVVDEAKVTTGEVTLSVR